MERLKRILVAYDGSPQSNKAIEWAIDLSLLTQAKVRAVKVAEMMEITPIFASGNSAGTLAEIEESKKADRELLDKAVKAGQEKGVAITQELLYGNVASALIEYSRTNSFDLIVVGTKGHGVLEGLLMGSVTRSLVSLSQIPVLVVK